MEKVPVLITTDKDKRGVFMGLIDPEEMQKDNVTEVVAEEVRMAVYWSSSVKGVVGLAATGPDKHCKISKATPKARLTGITAMMQLTDEALKAWRSEPWG